MQTNICCFRVFEIFRMIVCLHRLILDHCTCWLCFVVCTWKTHVIWADAKQVILMSFVCIHAYAGNSHIRLSSIARACTSANSHLINRIMFWINWHHNLVGAASTEVMLFAWHSWFLCLFSLRACLFSRNWAELEFDTWPNLFGVRGIRIQLSTHFPGPNMKSTSDS
jgi:hypothetical protein